MKRWLTFPAFVLASFLGAASAKDDSPVLAKAREAHDAAVKAADEKLLATFDKAIDQVTNQKLSTDRKLALSDAIKAEKKRFENAQLVPWSDPMWPYLVGYAQAVQAADTQLKKTFNAEIERQLKAKNEDAVRDLRAELKAATNVRVVARWGHQAGNGPRNPIVLFSNGRIGNKDGPATWTIDKSNNLTLRWPDPQAPGGAWLDKVTIAPNGLTYAGANQSGVKISGVYGQK